MCGIVGVSLCSPRLSAAPELLEASGLLQHRGQDACGIVCGNTDGVVNVHKGKGLVNEVFSSLTSRLEGNFGIGHVRYATNGKFTNMQIQPVIANERGDIAIVHNGNLENTKQLRNHLSSIGLHQNTDMGDSELMLELMLSRKPSSRNCCGSGTGPVPRWIVEGLKDIYAHCVGSFACVFFIPSYGLVACRDANGIKPIIVGERRIDETKVDYMFTSESVTFCNLGYTALGDIGPGEAVFVPTVTAGPGHSRCISQQIVPQRSYSPDIFEYVYFARVESIMDGISVNRMRRFTGEALARTIMKTRSAHGDKFSYDEIDCVIPVPDTSFVCALAAAQYMSKPLSFGLVKNRFVSRTFTLPTQKERSKAVSRKLGTVQEEFEGRNVLIIDDSIVRGTTAVQIVAMARRAGAKKVYFASGSPAIRYNHIHGIDLADQSKLLAYGRSDDEVAEALDCDRVFYLPLEDLIKACTRAKTRGDISSFETGMFNGQYTTRTVAVE